MKLFETESFKEKYRTQENNGSGQFSKCEYCGYENPGIFGVSIKYRHRYKAILCDRCTDNHDCVTVWTDDYAAKQGLPPYRERWRK